MSEETVELPASGDPLATEVNRRYAELFESSHPGLTEDIRRAALAEFGAAIDAEKRRRQPNRKLENCDMLEDEFVEPLASSIRSRYRIAELIEEKKRFDAERRAELERLCRDVLPVPDAGWYCLRVASTSTYSSQGYGAGTYAKASLFPLQKRLDALQFRTEIKETFAGVAQYELWANCPLWMADAIDRTITWRDALKAYGRTINPAVYNPFMSPDELDAHFRGEY